MLLYNLLEDSNYYSMTSGRFWTYYRDEVNDNANENNADNKRINNNKTITSKSFEYKAKLIGSTPNDNKIKHRSCCSIKIFEQFLDIFRFAID